MNRGPRDAQIHNHTHNYTHTHMRVHTSSHVDKAVWKLGQEAPKQVDVVRGGLLGDLNEPSEVHQGGEGRGGQGWRERERKAAPGAGR